LEVGIEFLATAADGIDVQAGDGGQQGVAAIAGFLGLQGGQPAALLLVEATHQEVDLVVELSVGMILPASARGTLARMDRTVGHDQSSKTPRLKVGRTLYGKTWKSFLEWSLLVREAGVLNRRRLELEGW
jgi:hypothetical protein